MIKAIITDIDGVIVGNKHGVNFPLPNELVIQKLITLHKKGLPIVFCTGKFQSGIQELVARTQLNNPHITDGGALIIDPLDNIIIKKHTLDKTIVEELVQHFIANNIYIEVYGVADYFIQKNQICDITAKHALVLQQEPKMVDDLLLTSSTKDVIKLSPYAKNDQEEQFITSSLKKFADTIHRVWTMHPTILPTTLCIVTVKGVSKRAATIEVLQSLGITPQETLAIGDTMGDWNFMELCTYVGTVGDHSSELKELAKTKGEGNYFFASSVDENGIMDILDYFIK